MLSFKPLHGFIAKMVLEIVDGGGLRPAVRRDASHLGPPYRISSTNFATEAYDGLKESIFQGGYLTWKKILKFFSVH